jgi:hypothetical protein
MINIFIVFHRGFNKKRLQTFYSCPCLSHLKSCLRKVGTIPSRSFNYQFSFHDLFLSIVIDTRFIIHDSGVFPSTLWAWWGILFYERAFLLPNPWDRDSNLKDHLAHCFKFSLKNSNGMNNVLELPPCITHGLGNKSFKKPIISFPLKEFGPPRSCVHWVFHPTFNFLQNIVFWEGLLHSMDFLIYLLDFIPGLY